MKDQNLLAFLGAPVDMAPWGYLYRADREIQSTPEA